MKACPQCGAFHADHEQRCFRCGALIDPASQPDPLQVDAQPGANLHADQRRAARRRPEPDHLSPWRLRWGKILWAITRLPENAPPRSPWLAGFLSLIPGLGQLYNRQPLKALVFLLTLILMGAVAALTIRHPLSNWILLGYGFLILWAFQDGIKVAREINGRPTVWQEQLGYLCAWIFLLSIGALSIQFIGSQFFFSLRHISGEWLVPHFRPGERVVVDTYTYSRRKPQVGEIVFYKPPTLIMNNSKQVQDAVDPIVSRIMQGRPTFDDFQAKGRAALATSLMSISPYNMIERIVAGPGDTFERRDGVFYLNGEPAPIQHQPLIQDQLRPDFRIQVPDNHYAILFTYTGQASDPLTSMTPDPFQKSPRLDDPDWHPVNWEEACTVPHEQIIGRVWLSYQPPQARRFIH